MSKVRISIVITALMLISMASCNSDEEVTPSEDEVAQLLTSAAPIQLTEAQKQMRDNNKEFAWKLFQEVQKANDNDRSCVLSPLSVTYLLGMMDAGAAGSTREEITTVLGFGDDVMAVNEYCKAMLDGAASVDPAATVRIANCIDVNSAMGISLLKQYVDDMKHYYNAQIEALDFTKGSTLDIINKWCHDNTDGMIPSILDELNSDAAMYLLNAIYFKAEWTAKFNKKFTRKTDFTLTNGTTVKRELMHIKALTLYGQDDTCSVMRLPFGNGAYGMYVLMPVEGVTTTDMIQGMTIQDLNSHLDNIYKAEVDILLPKFETSSDTELIKTLTAMGITSAFNPYSADFSNMSNASLYVSKMLQKAKIEVNEDGAKAAAVTIAGYAYTSYIPTPRVDFHATRPFLYLIREESTKSIFFIGTYLGES